MTLTYQRMISTADSDIPELISIFKLPGVSRYYSIDCDNYFSYVVNNPCVYFFKVYENNELIGAFHLEKAEETLYLSIVVFLNFKIKDWVQKSLKILKIIFWGSSIIKLKFL